ncbi:MAG: serine O-acetyltransferase [Clostridiales bacterium]|nr:serine O-acetyltransferase [Clostridiales bacterium]
MYIRNLKEDIRAVKERDPAARNGFEIFMCYPGFHAVRWHRRAHALWKRGLRFLPRFISANVRFFTGVDIHPGAVIGKGLFIDHASGVVIGETAVVGDNVTIYQGATLGGTGKDTGKRHPTIGNDVVIAAGAKILGPFKVGNGSKIGAGAVVLQEVPPYCTVVGVPGRIVKRAACPHGRPVGSCDTCDLKDCEEKRPNLDQIHLPDPIKVEIAELRSRIESLEALLKEETKEEAFHETV